MQQLQTPLSWKRDSHQSEGRLMVYLRLSSTRIVAIYLTVFSAFLAAGQSLSAEADRPARGDIFLSDFYRFDQSLPERPGLVLRTEPLDSQQSLSEAGSNLRLLYTSTDGITNTRTVPVSGALYLPKGEPPPGGWPLLAWTHGTVGIADSCAPSWSGRQAQDEAYLNQFLATGFAIVASDYQGLGTEGTHPYLASRPAAYSNLDMIRAVQGEPFPVSKEVILIGQSQGAGAAVASAGYVSSYAPELSIIGVVATGVPFFVPAIFEAMERLRNPHKPDPLLGYSFFAMTLTEQLDAEFSLSAYVSEKAIPIASRVDDLCYREMKALVTKAELTYSQSFARSPRQVLFKSFDAMSYPNVAFDFPVFVGTGGLDRDTPPKMQRMLISKMCEAGTAVFSKYYPDLDHRGVVPGATADVLNFVKRRFTGGEIETTCVQSE